MVKPVIAVGAAGDKSPYESAMKETWQTVMSWEEEFDLALRRI